MYGPVNAVTIDIERTAVVSLAEPHHALLLAMPTPLTPIILKHPFGDGTDPKVHPRNANPMGSGPFKLVEFKPCDRIIMERFNRSFLKDLPKLERIIRLTLDVDSILSSAELKALKEHNKPALAKVGIEVNVWVSPDSPIWARRVSSGQFEMTIDSVWNWGDPVIGVRRTWRSSNIRPGLALRERQHRRLSQHGGAAAVRHLGANRRSDRDGGTKGLKARTTQHSPCSIKDLI